MKKIVEFGFDQGALHGLSQTILNKLEEHRRLVWIVCATTALLTTRNLLIERNLHYPLQLYISQISATAITALCLYSWRRKIPEGDGHGRRKTRSILGTAIVVALHCLESLSMWCVMQAVMHTANLPLLPMIVTIAFFVEGLIFYIAGYTPKSRAENLRITLLLLVCVGVLYTEYRLSVPSLISSIPAMLFIGTAGAMRRLATKRYPEDMTSRSTDGILQACMGVLVAVVCAMIDTPSEHWDEFGQGSLLLRAVNAFSAAVALLIGGSILFPTNIEPDCQPQGAIYTPAQRVRDVLTLLTLTGVTGYYSTLPIRRSYVSWHQLFCFLFAVLCICGKDIYDNVWNRYQHGADAHGTYDLISPSTRPRSEDSGSIPLHEQSVVAETRAPKPESRGYNIRLSLGSIALIIIWIVYLSFNFGERHLPRVAARLDQKYKPTLDLEIVISMYKEKTKDVATLISKLQSMPKMSGTRVTVYLKDEQADEQKTKQETHADEVIKLPNIGREAETYLNHILRRWDTLAGQTLFLQADVHNPREFYPFAERYFRPYKTGFLNLGWAGNVCDGGENCGDRHGWKDEILTFPVIQSRIDNTTRENVLLSYKGQFVVTAARIRGIEKLIYEDLEQAFVDENSWAHQPEYLKGRKDSMSQPWFGYTMERIWNVLFQCSDMEIAWKCPTLLSGWRPGGSIADCQCFDEERTK